MALALLLLASLVTVGAQSNIKVVADGVEVEFTDVHTFVNQDNRTMVPLRAIGEAMGLDVNWIAAEKKAVFSKTYTWEDSPDYQDLDDDGVADAYLATQSVTFVINESTATHDMSWYEKGETPEDSFPVEGGLSEITMDTEAIIKDNRTYAPVRYLAEAFGYYVGWDGASKTVSLDYMSHIYDFDLSIIEVATWEEYLGWIITKDEGSEVKSIEILDIIVDGKTFDYRALTEEEVQAIIDVGLGDGYLEGFVVENPIESESYHFYQVKLLVTLEDGTQEHAYVDLAFYFDGQGGYI